MVLQGNIDVLLSLRDFYQGLLNNDGFPLKQTSSSDITTFADQINSFVYDSKMQIARGKLLSQNVAARKTIVGSTSRLLMTER